jgi:dephospho-CoA kinase
MRIGLTGGIGSGKSTVASMLVLLGAVLVDTDAIAKAITAPGGSAMPALEAEFGRSIVTPEGSLDRSRMREIAFLDPEAKKRLEAILHPLIGLQCERQAASARPGQTIVFDVPLLVESRRWRGIVDRVLVIDATEQTQLERVVARSGWTPDAVRTVIAQQADRILRRAAADAVIYNERLSLVELSSNVRGLWERWAVATTR